MSPFTPTKQAILIYALASVMTSVPQRSIGIILVVAASSANRRRLLSLDLELLSPSVGLWATSLALVGRCMCNNGQCQQGGGSPRVGVQVRGWGKPVVGQRGGWRVKGAGVGDSNLGEQALYQALSCR